MTDLKPVDGEKYLLKLLDGFMESKVLMTAFRLNVFTVLAEEWLTTHETIRALELPERSGEIMLNACVGLGLLDKDAQGRLSTPKKLAPFLIRGEDQPFRPTTYLIDYYHEVYKALADMDELVRTDGAASTFKLRDYFKDDVAEVKPEVARNYAAYMDATMDEIARVVLEMYPFGQHKYHLDLCGCAGYFSRSVLKANPSLKGGFIDVPACIEVGKEGIAADQLSDRMDAIAGNIFTDAFPKADLITLCRSAMDWGDEVIGRLYGKIRETLPLGGRVLIIERMLPEEMDARGKALFLRSVYFLAKSTTTRYRRPSEHAKLLKDAGFTDVEVREPPKAPYEFFQSMRMVVAAKTA